MYKEILYKKNNKPKKFLTFSYDDGVLQDRRLISMMRSYNIKSTFNLNSGLFGTESTLPSLKEGEYVDHSKVFNEEIYDLYAGMEVASHSLHHPKLWDLSDEELIHEVGDDAKKLERLSKQKVIGMAYPGGPFFDDRVINVILNNTDIIYARDIKETGKFDMPDRDKLMEWHPSFYHLNDSIFDAAEEFVNLDPEEDSLLYIWGHSYEFDMYDNGWEKIKKLFEILSCKDDIIYATNGEIVKYMLQ